MTIREFSNQLQHRQSKDPLRRAMRRLRAGLLANPRLVLALSTGEEDDSIGWNEWNPGGGGPQLGFVPAS